MITQKGLFSVNIWLLQNSPVPK